MKRTTLELTVLLLLVAAGAASRIVFRELPNFAPVAAIALFAGYFFRSAWMAVLAPIAAMVLSDVVIGGYQWQMMLVVYGALALPVAFRPLVRRFCRIQTQRPLETARSVAGLVGCSLACSLIFFLATNFAWWPWSDMYPKTTAGLVSCYAAGLPFFKYTLAGDLTYACLLFGTYAVAVHASSAPVATGASEINDATKASL